MSSTNVHETSRRQDEFSIISDTLTLVKKSSNFKPAIRPSYGDLIINGCSIHYMRSIASVRSSAMMKFATAVPVEQPRKLLVPVFAVFHIRFEITWMIVSRLTGGINRRT
ncbi:uncharacterized protein LOC105422019 isoform X1 [Pogonomyrmex barbatus]|uniref:Uncharacterized protein LOC105422019 isoform X1 n=2 Tax=Pogonomyrmex barbatus TaxID=144034 RepID=A0A6I9VM53_9HYME|nr:uncharacterized protein LOC105422019 isoform X1 [Pogonomyrmex barbatus]